MFWRDTRGPHSEHRFPAPSSKYYSSWRKDVVNQSLEFACGLVGLFVLGNIILMAYRSVTRPSMSVFVCLFEVCVCVCVWERERELLSETEWERESEPKVCSWENVCVRERERECVCGAPFSKLCRNNWLHRWRGPPKGLGLLKQHSVQART